MMQRLLGATGLRVPVIGLGAMQLGDPAMTENEAAGLLHSLVEVLPQCTQEGAPFQEHGVDRTTFENWG